MWNLQTCNENINDISFMRSFSLNLLSSFILYFVYSLRFVSFLFFIVVAVVDDENLTGTDASQPNEMKKKQRIMNRNEWIFH